MKHQPPKVEDYNGDDTPDPPPTEKRKRASKDQGQSQDETPELEMQQPPSKAAKSRAEDEEGGGVEGEENEEDDEGEDDEEYDQYEGEGDEDEGYEDEEVEGEGEEENEEEGEEEGGEDEYQNERIVNKRRAHKVVEEFGCPPLDRTPLAEEPLKPTPETILAMALDALVKSRPISHDLTQHTLGKLVEVGYHDIQKLSKSSWEERAMILKDGGYNRYREQGSTNLGDLAELVEGKYDGDLNNLLKKAGNQREKARSLVKEIKGLGDLGVDLFFNNVQSVWPSIAPFVDARSLKTAEELGIGTDLDSIYAELKKDPLEMSKFANGLSTVRLEKRQGQIEA